MRFNFVKYLCVFVLILGCVFSAGQLEGSAQNLMQDARNITAGESVTDSLDMPVEIACYKLTLAKNGCVEIDFDAPETGEWKITLRNENNEIYSFSSKKEAAGIGVKSGVYYITVAPVKYSAEEYTLTARFTESDKWEQEFNDSRELAGKLTAGKSVTGNLSAAADVDCFSFSLSEPRYVSFTFDAKSADGEAWALTVLNEENSEVIYSGISKKTDTEPTALQPGDYIVEITSIRYSPEDYVLTLNISDDTVVTRIEGKSRIQTAISISREGWEYDSTDAVMLASAYSYPDALAGVPLAYALDAPILLTSGKALETDVLREIERIGAEKVYILGGNLVITAEVADALKNIGYEVQRIAGKSRFDTAVEIAKKLQSVTGKKPAEVFFAYSHNYADALSIGSVAAIKKVPVLYIAADGVLSDATKAYLQSSGAKTATILGGKLAIAGAAENNIKKAGASTVVRIAGGSRYETCIKINERFASVIGGNSVCVATGLDYPDALAGGVFAAKNGAPLVLVPKKLTSVQTGYINSIDPDITYIFGGKIAVSEDIENQLKK